MPTNPLVTTPTLMKNVRNYFTVFFFILNKAAPSKFSVLFKPYIQKKNSHNKNSKMNSPVATSTIRDGMYFTPHDVRHPITVLSQPFLWVVFPQLVCLSPASLEEKKWRKQNENLTSTKSNLKVFWQEKLLP